MNVLVVGNGGREHALCSSIQESPQCEKLFCIPGSDAIASIAECHPVNINDNQAVVEFCKQRNITFVAVGPEFPLTNGLVDDLEINNIAAFGPDQKGAMLEKSKIYTKEICDEYDVPTGRYKKFNDFEEACEYCATISFPAVIKADGLAAGKGVIIAQNQTEAEQAVSKCIKEEAFSDAGKEIIIEEFLEGEEVSLFSIVDASGFILPLTTAQDHKKINEGEKGLNTGGMGAYCPAPSISNDRLLALSNQFVAPIVKALQNRGIAFRGMFYAGIILTKHGPRLLEVNVRFGDPETQAILPRIRSDVLEILRAASIGKLNQIKEIEWDHRYCMTVVMSTKGYPEDYPRGTPMPNLDIINLSPDHYVFHAGTKKQNGNWVSNGGRVLAVSSLGETINKARDNVYSTIDQIEWKDGYYRKDIGYRYAK